MAKKTAYKNQEELDKTSALAAAIDVQVLGAKTVSVGSGANTVASSSGVSGELIVAGMVGLGLALVGGGAAGFGATLSPTSTAANFTFTESMA